jgi:1,2-dihydroxy-3-keto-5-methylthiopentene dioxygenase
MSILAVQKDDASGSPAVVTDREGIASQLRDIGVQFEQWQAGETLDDNATQEEVLKAYQPSIDRLNEQYKFQSVDVVSLTLDHPDKVTFRGKFLAEHTHDDFEVRFFVDGSGLFYLHVDDKIYMVFCERGDLISVPANTTHWFDMGENPFFKCIRFFTTPEGWVGNFTGSDIAKTFPSYDEFVEAYR